MNLKCIAASVFALLVVGSVRTPARLDAKESVRNDYLRFVTSLNDLSVTVSQAVWTPDLVGRLLGVDLAGIPDPGMAKLTVGDVEVVSVEGRFAVLVAKRSIQWTISGGQLGPIIQGSALATLTLDAEGRWRVSHHVALSNEERVAASVSESQRTEVPAAFDGILTSMRFGDFDAVKSALSPRAGRQLWGEVGSFLRDSAPKYLDFDELRILAASDRFLVAIAKTTERIRNATQRTHSELASPQRESLVVFTRSDSDRAWKLEAEIEDD